jgi:hypothetical protein
MSSNTPLFDFEYDGKSLEWEYSTEAACQQAADEWWANRHNDEPMRNGQTREDSGFIIKFEVNDDGDRVELSREMYGLYFEYYHGDFKEHNTYGL